MENGEEREESGPCGVGGDRDNRGDREIKEIRENALQIIVGSASLNSLNSLNSLSLRPRPVTPPHAVLPLLPRYSVTAIYYAKNSPICSLCHLGTIVDTNIRLGCRLVEILGHLKHFYRCGLEAK